LVLWQCNARPSLRALSFWPGFFLERFFALPLTGTLSPHLFGMQKSLSFMRPCCQARHLLRGRIPHILSLSARMSSGGRPPPFSDSLALSSPAASSDKDQPSPCQRLFCVTDRSSHDSPSCSAESSSFVLFRFSPPPLS